VDSQLEAIAAELIGERFGPGRLRRAKVSLSADVIAERRRILLGEQPTRTERALRRDRELAAAIRKLDA
jgi:hypothetical protein